MVNTYKKKILFVDDELQALRALRRLLRDRRDYWDVSFAEGGEEGLELLSKESFDLVVSDVRMPEMDGVRFLLEVKKCFPDTGRLVLSGYSDSSVDMPAAGIAHRFLTKPCDAQKLKQAIDQTLLVREELGNCQLRSFVSGLSTIPSRPGVLTSLARALEDPKLDMTEVGDIIASDMGITAKVLQLVNNGQFFGAGGVVADPRKAADLLGQAIVQSLVSTLDMLEQTEAMGIDIEVLEEHWTHGLEVGVLARQIAARESADDAFAGEAFTAGLLHDVGKIILLANTVEYEALLSKYGVDEDEMHLCEAEEAAFGVTHAQVGAYLLGIWGFPDSIVEAVLYHHKPRASKQTVFSPLTAVHVANSVDYWLSNGSESQLGPSYCQIYLDRVGCGNKMNAWLMLGDVSKAEGLFGQALRHST